MGKQNLIILHLCIIDKDRAFYFHKKRKFRKFNCTSSNNISTNVIICSTISINIICSTISINIICSAISNSINCSTTSNNICRTIRYIIK
ncbi:uncharacterized protein LOC105843675 isoform X3 [Hydra vulgaris]